MLCKIMCHGRLVRDIQLETSEKGVPFCQFSLACPRYAGPQKGEVVEYPDFIAYRTTAENLAKYVQKGTELLIEAHYTSYRRKIEGVDRPVKTVVFEVDKYEFCGSRKTSEPSVTETMAAPAPHSTTERQKESPAYDIAEYEEIDGDPDDLPF